MAKKTVTPEIDENLINGLEVIVDILPRGKRPATTKNGAPHPLAGQPYVGVLQRDVSTAFFSLMAKIGHPLAETKNDNCSYDRPCGGCRRDVWQTHTDEAERRGLLVRVPRGKSMRNDKGEMERVGWVTFYRPGEFKGGASVEATVDTVLARIGVKV